MEVLLLVFLGLSSIEVLALPKGEQHEQSTEISPEVTTEKEEKGAIETCNEAMANNGLNYTSFWHGAAHGIHSIGLEEIQHFFELDAPVHNRIPVVNANLSSEQTILFNAPLRGYDTDFKTMALKVMAFFMLHDKPDFYQQGLNTLEKVSHQYHMHEIYAAAAPIYKKMKEDPPTDPDLCPCVNDVTANGILTEMVHIAKELKYLARQPRAKTFPLSTIQHSTAKWVFGYQTTTIGPYIRREKQREKQRSKRNVQNTTEMIAQYEQEYLADSSPENAYKIMELNPWKPRTLLGPKQWVSFEALLTWNMLDDEELNNFAVFMYCKLNQPELDRAKDLFD